MKKIDEKNLEKLDKLNLAWLIENISVGKVLRGIYRLTDILEPTIQCLKDKCCAKKPSSDKPADKTPQKQDLKDAEAKIKNDSKPKAEPDIKEFEEKKEKGTGSDSAKS